MEDCIVAEAAEDGEDEKEGQSKAVIADAIDHKGLSPGIGVVIHLVPETNEQIGTEPYTFPTDEHEQKVVGQNEKKHGEGEEIQVGEVAVKPPVLGHVSDGIDMNQEADPGDDQHHDR